MSKSKNLYSTAIKNHSLGLSWQVTYVLRLWSRKWNEGAGPKLISAAAPAQLYLYAGRVMEGSCLQGKKLI